MSRYLINRLGILFFSSSLSVILLLFPQHTPIDKLTFSSFDQPSSMLQVGEELEYRVSYLFFYLGKIRFQVLEKNEREGRTIYKVKAFVDSNPRLPFVDLHVVFESEMDQEIFSYRWTANYSSIKETQTIQLLFDYPANQVIEINEKRLLDSTATFRSIDTVRITDKCQDGITLFYYAREHVKERKVDKALTFVENELGNTYFNFKKQITSASIPSVDYKIEVIEFEGDAHFIGVFGLTGGFSGWFSNDDARIPIVARLNVILGSIKVTLDKWNREGWQPPKYIGEK